MEVYKFTKDTILLNKCESALDVQNAVDEIFLCKKELFPKSKDALVFLKPNLNNDQNALMGNSTDLRILTSVVNSLQRKGYRNITVGDGCNVGINRKNIDVFSRLRIDRIAHMYEINLLDLNNAPYKEIELEGGNKVRVAKICFEAELFINLPKIKTHAETQLSICLKNLVGCLSGGIEKKKMHDSLNANIVRLNKQVRPHLHIVDGLIAMEGNGPGDGKPKKVGLLVAGEDPFLIDAFCARLVGLEEETVPYLKIGRKKGYLCEPDLESIRRHSVWMYIEKPPPQRLLTRVLGHNIFMGLRNLVRPLFDNKPVTGLLYKYGLIQDVYDREDAKVEKIYLDRTKCNDCNLCLDYCPTNLPITSLGFDFSKSEGCIECLYCFFICPEEAIKFEGELGYLSFYIHKHFNSIKKLYKKA